MKFFQGTNDISMSMENGENAKRNENPNSTTNVTEIIN